MILNKHDVNHSNLSDFTVLDCRNVMDQHEKTIELISNHPLPSTTHIIENPFMYIENGINNGRHPLPYKEQITALYETLTKNGHKLLLVSNSDSFHHTRLYYLFVLYGFEVFLYNDDLNFIENNHHLFSKFEDALPFEVIGKTSEFKKDIYRSMEDVQKIIQEDRPVLLVDVRTKERYLGITEPIDFKKGHIPSAVNIPNPEIYSDGLLNLHALDDKLEKLNQYEEVIVYCGSGMSATPLFALLNEKGINVKVYGGSFSEWITEPSNEVETKENIL